MKKFLSIFIVSVMALMSFGFVSCTDDDDDVSLPGTWVTQSCDYIILNDKTVNFKVGEEFIDGNTLTENFLSVRFSADGTGSGIYSHGKHLYKYDGKWTRVGNTIYIEYTFKDREYVQSATIENNRIKIVYDDEMIITLKKQ